MTNRVYDVLKWVALVCLPAVEFLILTLGGIWGFDWSKNAAATVVALAGFLGLLLGVSSRNYANKPVEYDGEIDVDLSASNTEAVNVSYNLPLDVFKDRESVNLKVNRLG